MAKSSKTYICSECQNETIKWYGKCPTCSSFNTVQEGVSQEQAAVTSKAGLKSSAAIKPTKRAIGVDKLNSNPVKRTKTGIGELDRVLGGGFVDAEVVLFAGAPGAGKALSASTPIPTPNGFKKIENIQEGDLIFDGEGKITYVEKKFNPNVKKAFKMTFSNGQEINACEDHLWNFINVEKVRNEVETISTKEIAKIGVNFYNRKRWFINSEITETLNIELPFDPYTFGLWLADSASIDDLLYADSNDMKQYVLLSSEILEEKIFTLKDKDFSCVTIGKKRAAFKRFLKEFNLIQNKHIPSIFLQAGTEQRRELLRGLMDADGCADNKKGNGVSIESSNKRLVSDTKILVSSLGCATQIRRKQIKKNGDTYGKETFWITFQTNFDCFKLPRKLSKLSGNFKKDRIYLTNIVETAITEEYYCLMVKSESHTFLCSEGFIPTHNSTLSLTIADKFAGMGKKVLYSSGEESEQQIGLRAKRLGVSNDLIRVINESNLETLLGHIEEEKPEFLIVDSLQTLASIEIPGSAGSVTQSKEAAHTLTRIAKDTGLTMVLISQIIKSGDFSGSEAIQHIVDCAMIFESDVDSPLKFLRTTKNRFGDTSEVGIFQHSEHGLEEVSDPSGVLLENEDDDVSGASCSFISEGIRQMPVEIQALVTRSTLANPRKQFNGVNFQRGQIVCAILDKFCGAASYENDVFVSTVSGVKVSDPQADLSIAASVLSSKFEKSVPSDMIFIGELSLTGQVRGGFMIENKIKEAKRLGFTKVILPNTALRKLPKNAHQGISLVGISSVKELLSIVNK